MGVQLVQIGAQIRNFLIFSTRTCYRSGLRHPFIVGMLLILIFLYRSFPFVFSLLVSASPVIVSTAVLLGTLLSFGHPNIPEIEKEETSSHEISALKTGVTRDTIVVARDESSGSEGFTEGITEVIENFIKEKSSVISNSCEVDKHDSWVDSAPLTDEHVIEEAKKEPGDRGFEQGTDVNEDKICGAEVLENHYSQIQQSEDENTEMENDKLLDGSIDSRTDQLHSTAGSPWKHVEEDNEDDDVASDLGSDLAESSSPDASMADIMPLLDELHPLLDEEVTQLVHMSHDGSDVASEHSLESSDSSNESEDDITNQEGFGAGDDEEEEERHADKEDETKFAITWTEDDQKNLMNLGTSELERNQRLENLISRRRARKNMRMMAERNLIDLEADLPFNVAHISTARHNPFDLPFDSNDNIPGSAPSVLLPRRNPFDLPYDSSEEKPDLVEDTFRQDFGVFQPKEPFFRRHESFNVGPSFFGTSRHERQEIKFRPYFVPERIASEGSSYPTFQRQLSEVNESKESSVPETESMGSAGDLENGKHVEDDFSQEADLISTGHASEHVSHGSSVPDTESIGSGGHMENGKHIEDVFSQEAELISITHASEHVDHGSSVPDTESMCSEDGKHIEDDLSQEAELISITGHTSEHVGHGSPSSEDVEIVELGQIREGDDGLDETKINFRDMEDHQEVESSFGETGSPATPVEANLNEIHLNLGVEQEHNSRSSSSSLSEVNEEIFDEKEGEGLSTSVPASDYSFMDPSHSMQTLIEKSDNITSLVVEDSHQKEPVYDSSPRSRNENLSSSSISTDLQAEMSPMIQSPVKRSISFAERDSEASAQSAEEHTPDNDVELVDSSKRDAVDDMELGSRSYTEVSEPDVERFRFSKLDENSGGANALTMPDMVVEHNPTDSQPHSGPSVAEDLLHQDENFHIPDQLQSSSFNADLSVVVDQGAGKEDFRDSSSESNCAEDQYLAVSDKEEPPLVVEKILTILPDTSLPETEAMEEHLMDKEVPPQFEQGQVLSLNSGVKFHEAIQEEAEEKLVFPRHQSVREEKITSQPEKELQLSDESMENPEEMRLQLNDEMSTSNNLDISKTEELDNKVSPNIYSSFPPEPSDIKFEGIETKTPATLGHLSDDYNFPAESIDSDIDVPKDSENVDEINEIEENSLAELDTVGDFSIKDLGSNLNEIEKQQVTVEDSIISQHELETNSFGAEDCDTNEVCETKVQVDGERLMQSRIEEISRGGDGGASEVQISRTSSTEYANEVILPENVESTVNETDVHGPTTGVVSSVEHEVGTSSEGSSLGISDVKGKNEKSHKLSSSSSSSSSSDSSDSDKE